MTAAIGLVVVGAGYWGPDLVRNARATSSFRLRWLYDLDEAPTPRVLVPYSTVSTTDSFDAILGDEVQAVAIATPAVSHFLLAMAAEA
jgi:predicted dehydrogenase